MLAAPKAWRSGPLDSSCSMARRVSTILRDQFFACRCGCSHGGGRFVLLLIALARNLASITLRGGAPRPGPTKVTLRLGPWGREPRPPSSVSCSRNRFVISPPRRSGGIGGFRVLGQPTRSWRCCLGGTIADSAGFGPRSTGLVGFTLGCQRLPRVSHSACGPPISATRAKPPAGVSKPRTRTVVGVAPLQCAGLRRKAAAGDCARHGRACLFCPQPGEPLRHRYEEAGREIMSVLVNVRPGISKQEDGPRVAQLFSRSHHPAGRPWPACDRSRRRWTLPFGGSSIPGRAFRSRGESFSREVKQVELQFVGPRFLRNHGHFRFMGGPRLSSRPTDARKPGRWRWVSQSLAICGYFPGRNAVWAAPASGTSQAPIENRRPSRGTSRTRGRAGRGRKPVLYRPSSQSGQGGRAASTFCPSGADFPPARAR